MQQWLNQLEDIAALADARGCPRATEWVMGHYDAVARGVVDTERSRVIVRAGLDRMLGAA